MTITFEQIKNDSVWVLKMVGWRTSGSYDKLDKIAKSEPENVRDFDVACTECQPETVRPFWEAYDKYCSKNGFTFVRDFYEIYAKGEAND